MKKKIVYFDLDGVMADYYSQPSYKDNPSIPEKGFFESLAPIEGAIEAFKQLSEHYGCYFLTTASWSNIHSLSEKRIWVEKHLEEFAFKRLMTSHHKNLHIGDYLIDDRKVNGVEDFEGVHIMFGSASFPDWNSVVTFLESEYVRTYGEPTKREIDMMEFAEWVAPRFTYHPDEEYWHDHELTAWSTKEILNLYKEEVWKKDVNV